MCCRVCILTPLDELLAALMAEDAIVGSVASLPHYNLATGQPTPILLAGETGRRRLEAMHWGLIPGWSRDAAIARHTINARIETLADKPAFRHLIGRRHCLFPVSGYYEWQHHGRERLPFLIRPTDSDGLLLLAGLWDLWTPPGQAPCPSFTVITRPASPELADIHPRMPAILPPDAADAWLGGDRIALAANFAPLAAQAVSLRVNRIANNDPGCLAPHTPEETPDLFAS